MEGLNNASGLPSSDASGDDSDDGGEKKGD